MWSADRLVDDVARTMTSAVSGVDLRSVVRARIERRRSWRAVWIAAPIAGAALVVVAVAVRQPQSQLSTPSIPAAMVRTSRPTTLGPAVPNVSSSAASVPAHRTPATPLPYLRTIAVLSGPVALSTPSIQPDALAIPLLNVKPIATEPLAMTAIDDGSGGGRQPRFE